MIQPARRSHSILGLLVLAMFAPVLNASAATWYVATNGNDLAAGTDWTSAKRTIQAAVDVAESNDVVLVNDGRYDAGFRSAGTAILQNRLVITNAITVQSVNGPAATAIVGVSPSGNSAIRCVYVGAAAVLYGFTITNGATRTSGDYVNEQSGGGLWCVPAAIITNCLITGNACAGYGAGSYYGSFANCRFVNNRAGDAGGGCYQGTLERCLLQGNSASLNFGGGAHGGTLKSCALWGNVARAGGGAYSATMNNCTVTGNRTTIGNGGGVLLGTMNNCIVYFNTAASGPNFQGGTFSNSCTTPVPAGTGNITNNPALASASHLSAASPCIGAGSASLASGLDIDGEPWGNPPSMGCDESVPGSRTGALTVALQPVATSALPGVSIPFTALIDGPTTASTWNFGDGVIVSNAPFLTHSFASAGVFSVVLTAFNDDQPAGISATGTVQIIDLLGLGALTASPTNAWIRLPVTFNAIVTGHSLSNRWNFGDGSSASNATNVVHAFATAGVYTATFTAYNVTYASGISTSITIRVADLMTHYVRIDNPTPVAPYTNWATAATNIQQAVDAANQRGAALVLVSNGTYATGGRFWGGLSNRVAITNAIEVRSVNGPEVTTIVGAKDPATTNGIAAMRCVYVGTGSVFSGFTLTNGHTSGTYDNTGFGGGAFCESILSVVSNCVIAGNTAYAIGGGTCYGTITHCTITGNRAEFYGGGAYGDVQRFCTIINNTSALQGGGASGGTLVHCTLSGNVAILGGGASSCTLSNCVVAQNSGSLFASATWGGGADSSTLNNCLVLNNTAKYGGGANNCTLNNCTVFGNLATATGGGTQDGTINNSILVSNTAPASANFYMTYPNTLNYCCTLPSPGSGAGNITNDPRFVDAAGGDFHLLASSPCIDAGNNASMHGPDDADGNPRRVNGTVDIGALEFQTPARLEVSPVQLDFGLVLTGSTAQASFIVTNSGSLTLTGSAQVAGTAFTLAGNGLFELAAGSATNLAVQFAPSLRTTFTGAVIFTSTGGGSTNLLMGTGAASILGVSGTLAFGEVITGQLGAATMTLTNAGNLALTVASISYPTGFSGAWTGTIAAGSAVDVSVTFAPESMQTYGGTISVISDATDGSGLIACSGTGVASIIFVAGALDFGDVITGQQATATMTISNAGNRSFTVQSISYPTGFSGAWTGLVEAGAATDVVVSFAPLALQTYGGTITIHSDATGGDGRIACSGTGIATPPAGSLLVHLLPQVVSTSALWQLDGGSTYGSGTVVTGLQPGVHTIHFQSVTGWKPPQDRVVNITDHALTTLTALYVQAVNDFNGDGRSDLVVYGENGGMWTLQDAGIFTSSWTWSWGYVGAMPVPGDFDGDGLADFAVYDTARGDWFIQNVASSNLVHGRNWGFTGALPVTGDYDGDGRSDLAVYDHLSGNWYIQAISGTNIIAGRNWGYRGAVAVPGDYDGDGRSDLAVYDLNSGDWHIQTITGTNLVAGRNWGYRGAQPVAGDYDGDGRSDLAVYDRSNGAWFIQSVAGTTVVARLNWGYRDAVPVAGDYDGDGRSDLAVYDRNMGLWYVVSASGKIIVWAQQSPSGTQPVR